MELKASKSLLLFIGIFNSSGVFFRKGEGRLGAGSLTYFYAFFPNSSLWSDMTTCSGGIAWLTFIELNS